MEVLPVAPLPAAAIVLLLPVYLHHLGLDGLKSAWALKIVLVYTLFIAFMMVSTIPTFSGKLLGERVGREWVLPIFIVSIGGVAMLVTYPYETLAALTIGYLAMIPVSWKRFQEKVEETARIADSHPASGQQASPPPAGFGPPSDLPAGVSEQPVQPSGKIFPLRPGEPSR